jgi:hypothetical protein
MDWISGDDGQSVRPEWTRCKPQRASRRQRIECVLLPPQQFIAAAMDLAMVRAT